MTVLNIMNRTKINRVKFFLIVWFMTDLDAFNFLFQPKDQKFEFPDLFPKEKEEEMEKQKEQIKILEREYKNTSKKHLHRKGVPGWFGV